MNKSAKLNGKVTNTNNASSNCNSNTNSHIVTSPVTAPSGRNEVNKLDLVNGKNKKQEGNDNQKKIFINTNLETLNNIMVYLPINIHLILIIQLIITSSQRTKIRSLSRMIL